MAHHGARPSASNVRARLNTSTLAITIPQANLVPQMVYLNIMDNPLWDDVVTFICVSELHRDQRPHLHALIELRAKRFVRHADLDALFGKHGNYGSVRNRRHWLQYIWKAQANPPSLAAAYTRNNGIWTALDVQHLLDTLESGGSSNSRAGITTQLAAYLLENRFITIQQLMANKPEFAPYVLGHHRQVCDFLGAIRALYSEIVPYRAWTPFQEQLGQPPEVNRLYSLLNTLAHLASARRLTRPNTEIVRHKNNVIFIWGPPDMHKTSLILHLSRVMKIMILQQNKDFIFNGVGEEQPDVCIWENFRFRDTDYEHWEYMADANPKVASFNHKGTHFIWQHRPIMIFISNTDPERNWFIRTTNDFVPDPNGSQWKDILNPEHRAAYRARSKHIFHITTPMVGFPNTVDGNILTLDMLNEDE